MTKKESKWIKFYPSLELPKERVSIAYDTHDERGYRFAYGYFQFYNGTCGCFWKDGNEQPKVVKAEDIKYWMPVPSLDVEEEPVSEKKCIYSKDNYTDEDRKVLCDGCEEECKYSESDDFTKALAECIHQSQWNVVDPMVHAEIWKDELIKLAKSEESVSEDLGDYTNELSKQFPEVSFAKLSRIAVRVAKWQMAQIMKDAVEVKVKVDAGGYPYVDRVIELYDYDKDIPLAKEGDKYKVVLIKED